MNAPEISWEHGKEKTRHKNDETGGQGRTESDLSREQLGRVQRQPDPTRLDYGLDQ